jgi:NADP-dependent 3-hydroxy acid dehydrogenase YdfG
MSVTDMIEGKVIALTGASSGIGEATARVLAARGARLVLGARREERLAALAGELGATYRVTDVTRRDDVHALVAHARDVHGRLDVLISNAGIGPISPLDELKVDEWDAMIDVNLKGVLHGIAAALPVFREQGFGHFVNTSSTAAHRILPTMAVYSATKLAVNVISEGLRQEAGPDLRVTVITPGMTNTAFASDITSPTVLAQIADAKASIGMSPDAIARAIAYAIEQPAGIDVGEVIVRPTAQA